MNPKGADPRQVVSSPYHRDSRSRRRSMIAGLLFLSGLAPGSLQAQNRFEVQGRVYDAESNEGIPNATLALDDLGSTLSDQEGRFRLSDVPLGDHMLRIEAFGYLVSEARLSVVGDVDLSIPLEIDPFQMDTIKVELSTIDFDGRARDPVLDINVMDAEVRSDQGHEERTNTFGRFDLDDVYERIPLRIIIRGFGYLPLDTTFVPDDEERRNFGLAPDPVVRRMLDLQVDRLIDRGEYFYESVPPLNREDMVRFDESENLQTVIERMYPRQVLRRIGCFFLDELEISTGPERTHLLKTVLVNELGRIELFEFPDLGRLFMLRVYTRRFFQRHLGDNQPMRVPSMVDVSGGRPFCR